MNLKYTLKKSFLETVENQLLDNEPLETGQTMKRLREEGFREKDAKQLISACVAAEMFNVMNNNEPFNRERYVEWLLRLPELPE